MKFTRMGLQSAFLFLTVFKGVEIACQIDNGLGATPGRFPYQVFITQDGEYICGGGIIDAIHVITSAHCVAEDPRYELAVIAGAIHLNDNNAVNRSVNRIHVHPYYFSPHIGPHAIGGNPSTNDIAVLTLISPFRWENRIRPMVLPTNTVEATDFECIVCYFAGLGRIGQLSPHSRLLQYIVMKILTARECSRWQHAPAVNEFCAQDIFVAASGLEGDSGGAIVCNDVVVGIFKGSDERPGYPQIFTSVYAYLDFINMAREN
ncbi:granzyme B [Diachasma alloeum]|uniref:granzyme B n=1 Tax=Diachasma alloeum TaxID=454923 RepID=UPI0007382881|nr:granzyme B [Diachasma alloeum]